MRPYLVVAVLIAATLGADEPTHAGKTVPQWLEQLENEDPEARMAAVRALRAIGSHEPDIVDRLAKALADDSYRVRGEAASALAAAGAKAAPATQALAEALKDTDTGVRTCAAVALGKIGEPALATADALAEAMGDTERSVQIAACAALEALPLDAKKRVETSLRAASSPHSVVRSWGLRRIGEIGEAAKEAEPLLLKTLEDGDGDLRRRAAEALGRIGASDAAIPPLTRAIADGDEGVAEAASVSLAAFGERVSPPLLELFRLDDRWLRASTAFGALGKKASWAIPPLVEMLRGEDGKLRERAALTLAKMGDPGQEALRAVRSDRKEDEEVRRVATAALGGAGSSDAFGTRLPGKKRQELLERGGGSAATEAAVRAALDWLARHQSADGGWKCEGFADLCTGAKCEGAGGWAYEVGVTGLALLAYLGAGHLPDPLPPDQGGTVFGLVVKRGLDGLMARQKADGSFAASPKPLYDHAIATLALVEAYGMTGEPTIQDAAQSAVDYLQQAKNPYKAWRYTSKCGANDSSITGWCVAALCAAEQAGLNVGHSALVEAKQWLDEVTDKNHGRVGYQSLEDAGVKVNVPGKNEDYAGHEALAALGMLIRMRVDADRKDPLLEMGAKLLANDLPVWDTEKKTTDYYYWHQGTLALFLWDGPGSGGSQKYWKSWNQAVVNALLKNQRTKDRGCACGSWDADDRWGFAGGRVYATAINALTLETFYRYPVGSACGK